MFIVKATNKDVVFFDEVTDVVHEERYTDFGASIAKFVDRYTSGAWDHVDLVDSETGEVYAYFNAAPFELWASEETTQFMISFILNTFIEQD